MNIAASILQCIKQLPQRSVQVEPITGEQTCLKKRKLVLAYSGGVDSEILAHGLSLFAKQHLEFECLLVHVHHGLSGNADKWAEHCLSQADVYGLSCIVKRVEVKLAPRVSVEAQARSVRYAALLSELEPDDLLMTAHHQDDQLETVLLALKRGLGPKGLSAMGKVQGFNQQNWIIRPLLDYSKAEIQAYAKQHDISHIEDESNFDDKYDRNFLRLEVIPALKQRWSAIAATASRSAELCALQQSVIDEEIAIRLPELQQQKGRGRTLCLDKLATYSKAWQSLLLRGHMESQGFAPPSKVQGEQILAQLLEAKVDASVEIRLTDVVIRRFKREGYFLSLDSVQNKANKVYPVVDVVNIDALLSGDIALPTGGTLLTQRCQTGACLRFPTASEQVSIVFALPGSTRCQPHNRSKGRELKKLWQELALPPWERGDVPLLCYDGKLVAAVGYWIEKSFLARDGTSGLSLNLRQS
ncbi:tRNA lysidine(34) synthetase TilS [Shewanella schlegeliana]|uniref:tRNA(Ile)-lysidine synthase n=1 Tax=Shewanella schlegeliana TaxID=190308 RepID=A0ABS1SY12_9GAMM|nr:tRNA lysidine(34) synthetase TilS [Shewanella schlegeliana]MBL4913418.1 tRNA lysidine(34) synthetase TilS [Shewanella schlegeliana]MCL1108308.1 tRNA lysidine(34) synthetase TilS [Shewanella schlegeliana]GIU34502.1 tRNA(Ile)-lysidine synthase [Shewanella schlegeliana]